LFAPSVGAQNAVNAFTAGDAAQENPVRARSGAAGLAGFAYNIEDVVESMEAVQVSMFFGTKYITLTLTVLARFRERLFVMWPIRISGEAIIRVNGTHNFLPIDSLGVCKGRIDSMRRLGHILEL
jgi:hypothetical protein